MKISARTFEGKVIPLEVQPDDTIESVKQQIQKKERIRVDLQRLFFKNEPLQDSRSLSSYNVVEDSNLHVVLRAADKSNTVAGGYGLGNADNEFCFPYGLAVDDDGAIVIADWGNHRIVKWKKDNYTHAEVIAGGNGQGNGLHQLNGPTDVIIDKETNSLIICDRGNRRVMLWSRQEGTTEGEVLLDEIACWGVAAADQRHIYVSDVEKDQVTKYSMEERTGSVVIGGKGRGSGLSQLNQPTYIFVDSKKNVYVSDTWNHRVMKYTNGSEVGSVVARGFPRGIFVDASEQVYVADYGNHRLICWSKEGNESKVIGGRGAEADGNQLYFPWGIASDQQGQLYVTDHFNHRVQRFSLQ